MEHSPAEIEESIIEWIEEEQIAIVEAEARVGIRRSELIHFMTQFQERSGRFLPPFEPITLTLSYDDKRAFDPAGADEYDRQVAAEKAVDQSIVDQAVADKRRRWMHERHPGWSLVDWSQHCGLAYETLKKYQSAKSTRNPYIRDRIARAEKVLFSEVPE